MNMGSGFALHSLEYKCELLQRQKRGSQKVWNFIRLRKEFFVEKKKHDLNI